MTPQEIRAFVQQQGTLYSEAGSEGDRHDVLMYLCLTLAGEVAAQLAQLNAVLINAPLIFGQTAHKVAAVVPSTAAKPKKARKGKNDAQPRKRN